MLTSGTLSPMASFASELRLPFPVRLENPHVIGSNQVWGGIVPVGPSGKKLNSSYRFRDTEEYKAELGNVVGVNFARRPGRFAGFFPSYGVMQSCVTTWQQHGNPTIWERICAAKFAVVEPRDKVEFARAFAEFNEALDAPRAETERFYAVCRGKVSEGIDFADKAGRAVILTGIPYAPKADAKVRIKRSFLDNEASAARAEGGAGRRRVDRGAVVLADGDMRAVNQALGRVIRHRNDFGAVILADERFGYGNVRGQLSVWLRPAVQSFDRSVKPPRNSRNFSDTTRQTPRRLPKKPTGARFDALGGEPNVDGSNPVPDAARANASGATRAGRVALPAQFRVEVDAAPPAYPRANGAGKLAAMLAAKRGTGTPGTGTGTGIPGTGTGTEIPGTGTGTEIPGTGTRTPGTGTGRISARPPRERPPRRRRRSREHPPPPSSPRTPPRRSNSSCVARARS